MLLSFASYCTLSGSCFISSAAAIVPPEYWNVLSDFQLVAMNRSKSNLYFLHSDTSGRPQLDDAPVSAMDVFTFLLRNFHFKSASYIYALLAMATTSQVCSGVDCHPDGARIWLMKFGLTCSLTWQGGGATGDSAFLYDFSIRLMLATFI